MATRNVKRLHDLEIDEISLVDRGANQHATVAIAKRAESDTMTVFDSEGYEVFDHELADLTPGTLVYDEDGTEYVVSAEDEDGTSASLDGDYDAEAAAQGYEPELVGKGMFPAPLARTAGARARYVGQEGKAMLGRNKKMVGGVAGGAAAGAAAGRYSKRDDVLETLSKALREGDRDEALEGVLEYVQVIKSESDRNAQLLQHLLDEQDLNEYTELAQGYGVPADPARLGRIMKSLGGVLSDADFAEVDRVLSGAGAIYQEIGSAGSGYTSTVMDQIQAIAGQTVAKSDLSEEQAVVALFEANPAAYDEYVAENR